MMSAIQHLGRWQHRGVPARRGSQPFGLGAESDGRSEGAGTRHLGGANRGRRSAGEWSTRPIPKSRPMAARFCSLKMGRFTARSLLPRSRRRRSIAARRLSSPNGACRAIRSWSPDGKKIAWVSTRVDHSFIMVYDVATRSVKYMSPSVDFDTAPMWTADSKHLIFMRQPGLPFGLQTLQTGAGSGANYAAPPQSPATVTGGTGRWTRRGGGGSGERGNSGQQRSGHHARDVQGRLYHRLLQSRCHHRRCTGDLAQPAQRQDRRQLLQIRAWRAIMSSSSSWCLARAEEADAAAG